MFLVGTVGIGVHALDGSIAGLLRVLPGLGWIGCRAAHKTASHTFKFNVAGIHILFAILCAARFLYFCRMSVLTDLVLCAVWVPSDIPMVCQVLGPHASPFVK